MDTASNKSAVTLFSFHTGMFRVMGAFCSTHLQTFLFILLGCRLKRTYCINGVQLLLRNVQMYFPRNTIYLISLLFSKFVMWDTQSLLITKRKVIETHCYHRCNL